jgi:hypothetical protein
LHEDRQGGAAAEVATLLRHLVQSSTER